MIRTRSSSVIARRNWPRPRSMPAITSPSGPWQFAQVSAVGALTVEQVGGGLVLRQRRYTRDRDAQGENREDR